MTDKRSSSLSIAPAALAALVLAACASVAPSAPKPVTVKVLAITDLHGRLEPPRMAADAPAPGGGVIKVPVGGAAYLASAVARLRRDNPHTVMVSAGDNVGASPLTSNLFLDEPVIEALNLIGLDYTAVGNHEFDRGLAELMRLKNGGCAKNTAKPPCRLAPGFAGARFGYLAGNVTDEAGRRLFAPYAIRSFGKGRSRVRVAFIGLALTETPRNTTASVVKGLSFQDEAEAANALVPELKKAGADAIVVLVHDGGRTPSVTIDKSCGLPKSGFTDMLARLDPAIDVVVSGHSHWPYICEAGRIDPALPVLVTNAGMSGAAVTEISLTIDPDAHRLIAKSAENRLVQSEAYSTAAGQIALSDAYPHYSPEPRVAALVARYGKETAALEAKSVGRLSVALGRERMNGVEPPMGNLVADAFLAATRGAATGRADLAMTNPGGVRANLDPGPGGRITFGQIFAVQPFDNQVIVKGFTGRQLRQILERQFAESSTHFLLFSANLHYRYDLTRPAGARVLEATLDGAPLQDERVYRLATNSFMAEGGEDFPVLGQGVQPFTAMADIEALERYFAASPGPVGPPVGGRAINAAAP